MSDFTAILRVGNHDRRFKIGSFIDSHNVMKKHMSSEEEIPRSDVNDFKLALYARRLDDTTRPADDVINIEVRL